MSARLVDWASAGW